MRTIPTKNSTFSSAAAPADDTHFHTNANSFSKKDRDALFGKTHTFSCTGAPKIVIPCPGIIPSLAVSAHLLLTAFVQSSSSPHDSIYQPAAVVPPSSLPAVVSPSCSPSSVSRDSSGNQSINSSIPLMKRSSPPFQ